MPNTEPAGRPHRNHGLFSDHYLNATLPGRPDWQALATEAEGAMAEVSRILDAYAPSQNEAQTEEDLVRPVLRALGHEGTYEVQPALETPEGTKRPDYVFYRDTASRDADKDRRLTDEILKDRAFAVGDAKFWERPLDASLRSGSRDAFSNKNPSYQISFYMRHAGTEWGILTNGRLWRLYHRDTAHKLDRFYEVDLPALISSGNPEDFLYFFAFFRREAFDEGPLSVRALLAESADYARSVGDSLKNQVYDALRHLAQGFLDQPRNGLGTDAGALREIYDNSLIVLYRLLFVLYAESRDLLPVRASTLYRETYSLYAIKRAVAEDLDRGRTLLATSARRWQELRDLFGIIERGDGELGVATFDGGLFDPERHPFLEEFTVGDRHLQEAIDRLTRVDGQFVDYRDLAERHLGTIYEGLLEYHLQALPEPEDGWTIDLINDMGERKAAGAYYTPDFVVKYIVEATVDPLLREAVERAKTDAEKVEAVLALNVLDPSMGSGHFLVEVTERIARFLVELGVAPDEVEAEAELAYWKRRVVQSCVYGVDLNPLAVDLAKLSLWLATVARARPLSFLDHHLRTGNSLIGAHTDDLRPAEKKRRKKAAADDGQLSMLADDAFRRTVSNAVGNLWLIEDNPADTVDDVKEQEHLYNVLRENLNRRYARLADLATATHFGVDVDRSLWTPLADYATRGGVAAPRQFDAWLEQSKKAARERRFFHWELEFPEVYFDRQGRPLGDAAGFDAVVGNPPYVRQESLGDVKPYLAGAYPETYHGVADIYVYFYDQGMRQLRRGGRMSYIVTNKWFRAGYGEPLRGFFAAEGALEEIVDFGHAPIFPDADVFPCIVVLQKPQRPTSNGEVRVVEFPREALRENADLAGYIDDHAHTVPKKRFGKGAWSLETAAVDDLMAKIRANGTPLAEYAGVKPYRGVLTGLNEAFLIDTATRDRLVREDPRSADVIKPYLRGQDIKRWSPEWNGLWMIFARRGIDIDAYPAVKRHLEQFRERLEPRPKDWSGGRWPGRKPGLYKWYEIQDAIDYFELFDRPKILYQEIQFHSQYGFDTSGLLTNNKGFFLPSADSWIIAVLNSPLMWWHNWRHLPHMKDEALSPVGVLMEKLPIARPTDEVREEVEEVVGRLISLSGHVRDARRDFLDWLRVEFGVEKPGQKLEAFADLDPDAFVGEVRKRRPKSGGRLTPASLRDLRSGYEEGAAPVREARAEAAELENRLSDLVNETYGLTSEEVDLLWSTAPPRMPRF
jgi:hypothetical protein